MAPFRPPSGHLKLNSAAVLLETNAKAILMYSLSTYKGLELYVCDLNPCSRFFLPSHMKKMCPRGAGGTAASLLAYSFLLIHADFPPHPGATQGHLALKPTGDGLSSRPDAWRAELPFDSASYRTAASPSSLIWG